MTEEKRDVTKEILEQDNAHLRSQVDALQAALDVTKPLSVLAQRIQEYLPHLSRSSENGAQVTGQLIQVVKSLQERPSGVQVMNLINEVRAQTIQGAHAVAFEWSPSSYAGPGTLVCRCGETFEGLPLDIAKRYASHIKGGK